MIGVDYKFSVFFLLCIIGLILPLNGYAQKPEKPYRESFEHISLSNTYKTEGDSQIDLSKKRAYFGASSLRWKWKGESAFTTTNFRLLPKEKSPLRYGDHFPSSPIFIMSIYNESESNGELRISFNDIEGTEKMFFPLPLDFEGWRTIWVPFYEMEGKTPKKTEPVQFQSFTVASKNKDLEGKLYFDDIIFSQYQDDRHSYPDMLVPFIKDDLPIGSDHWMPLIRDMQRISKLEEITVKPNMSQDLAKIERRVDADFDLSNKTQVPYIKALKEYKKLNLKEKKTYVSGPPLTFQLRQVYFPDGSKLQKEAVDIKEFGGILKKLASYYQRASKEDQSKIKELFINASKYYLDQGWQAGSSGGTRHHIGYGVRNLTEAFYMMKTPLKEAGLLNDIGNSLKWLFNLGKILGPEEEFQANVDYYNTQSFYHLMLIFMTENSGKQAALLNAYSNYMSITLAQDDEKGVFKKDGTVWHHRGHYPAYGLGAFRGIPPIIHALSGTKFRISTEGHRNFKKAFLATRLYSQMYDYGFGNAGRHPLEDNSIETLKKPYLLMVYSGNPEHTSEIDKDVAAAYLRLWGKNDPKNAKIFREVYQVEAENLPGYTVFPYASTAVHRRNDWAAIIKGYSKYVWASEIYVDENRYGRYPANGSIQLLNKKGEEGSGFNQNGWDWNHYPGTTVIELPLEELEIKDPLLMFKSSETFTGAVKLGGNGIFAMKLNESKGENADGPMQKTGFPGKLKANKSVFSFGNKLIVIGTNISSINKENEVQTNLFQNYLSKKDMPIFLQGNEMISKFPFQKKIKPAANGKTWILDAYNNAYHILAAKEVVIKRQEQDSYHNKYSIRTGKMNKKGKGATETKGDYAVAWLNHGTAPQNSSYQYVIYPDLQEKERENFPKNVTETKDFVIKQADSIAHIVTDLKRDITGFAIFNSKGALNNKLLKSVSVPALLMIKTTGKEDLEISALNPDLNMPKFEDKTKSGWSLPVDLSFRLEGNWALKDKDTKVKSISSEKNMTTVTIENQHGISKNLHLKRIKE